MPDLKQSLRDFVATSNSGKYKSEDELLSKFPEFQNTDRQALKDFVATSNSKKYKDENELFSKFGDILEPVKKKDSSQPTSTDQQSASNSQIPILDSSKLDISAQIDKPKPIVKPEIDVELRKAKINAEPQVKAIQKQKLAEFRQTTQLNDQDQQEVQQQLADKKGEVGFFNTAKSLVQQAGNYITKGAFVKDNPLQEEITNAKSELIQSGIAKPTPEQVNQKAEEIFVDKSLKNKKQAKVNDYLSTLNDHDKYLLEVDADERFKSLDQKDKDLTNRISLNSKYADDLMEDLKDPNITPQDRETIQAEIKRVAKDLDTDFSDYHNNTTKLGTAEEEFDAFKRNYGKIDNFAAKALASIADAGLNAYSGANYVANTLGAGEEYKQDLIAEKQKGLNEFKGGFRPNVEGSIENMSLNDFARYTGDLIADQTGTLLAMSTAGAAGGASILGLGQAGQTYSEMYKENKSGKGYTPAQMAIAPLISGVSTGVFSELPTFKTLQSTKRVIASAFENEASREVFKQGFRAAAKNVAIEIGKAQGREVGTEEIDNLIQNAVHRDILGDKKVGYFDNAEKVFTDTALLTGLLHTAPHLVFGGVKALTPKSQSLELDSNGNKISELSKQLDNPDLDADTKKVVEKQINSITRESSAIVNETVKRIEGLEPEEIKSVLKDSEKVTNIQQQASDIKNNDAISYDAKKVLLSGLEQEHKVANERIDEKLNEDINKPVERTEDQLTKTEEVEKPQGEDIVADENVRSDVGLDNTQQQDNSQESAADIGTSGDTSESKIDPIEFAKQQIENGTTLWSGNMGQPRIDLGMSWADIRKGEADIKRGKVDSVPAKRLIEAFQKAKEEGGYHYKYGTGIEAARDRQFVTFEDMERSTNEDNLTDAETEQLNKDHAELAKEYDDYFDSLSEDEQTEILENYETGNQESTGKDTVDTESKMDVTDETSENSEPAGENRQTGSQERESVGNDGSEGQTDRKDQEEDLGTFEKTSGKKSLLTRAATGNNESIKKAIEKYSLDYEVENQEQARKNAEAFVDEVGIESAVDALRSKMIDGAEKAFVYAKVIDDITKSVSEVSESEQSELEKLHIDVLGMIADEFDQDARKAGQFISALNKVYNSSDGQYALKKQISDYKAINNGAISDEVLEKFVAADKKIKELEKQRAELVKKLEVSEAQNALNDIIDADTRSNSSKARTESKKVYAKKLANKIREAKIHKPDIFSSASPASLVWDGAIEIVAKSIEAGGTIADAIDKGIAHIKKSKWYKSLGEDKKKEAESAFEDHVSRRSTAPKYTIDEKGKLSVSHSFIVELVKSGIKDIDGVSEAVLNEIKKDIPDTNFDLRSVRDAITSYGKTINPTKDEILLQIGEMKRVGRLISGIEDTEVGKRPKKTGLIRPEPTLEERSLKTQLREALRDLPLDDAELEKTWKTALDSIKKRLENQIEDLDKQIEKGEKRKPEKNPVKYDQEALDLKSIRDQKRDLLDELVGKPELTEEQKINKVIQGLTMSIERMQQQIVEANIEYKEKPSPVTNEKIESLRKRKEELAKTIEQMRQESGIAEKRRLESAKKYRLNRIAELNERIKNKDFAVKERKPLPIDKELLDIDSKLQEAKDVYEKEKYVDELKNRSFWKKIGDGIINTIGLTRVLKAGGEFSAVLVQMGFLTPEMIVNDIANKVAGKNVDAKSVKAFGRLFAAMALPDVSARYEAELKASPLYPLIKKAKLAITGTDHRLDAQEENFQVDLATNLWNRIGQGLDKLDGGKERKTPLGVIKSLLGKDLSESDMKTLGTQFREGSPWKVFERGAVAYSNYVKLEKFQQGVTELQKQGYDPINDVEMYKKVADYVNVFSGRASLGDAERLSKFASLFVFSLRNAVSQFQQLNPYFYAVSLGDPKNPMKPTVAQKMAVKSFVTSFTAIAGFTTAFIAAANAGKKDDEEKWQVETDPRSSDFMKMRKGKTTFDMWHGLNPLVVLYARLFSQKYKSTKSGDVKELGVGFGTPTSTELVTRYATNKLAPAAGYLYRLGSTHEATDPKTGENYRVDPYGNVYGQKELLDLFVPIYWNSVHEIQKEDPDAYQQFLTALGLFGMNTGTDQQSTKFKELIGDTSHKNKRKSRKHRSRD